MNKNTQHRSGDNKSLQQFFKVFLPQTSSTQLRIPKAFTKFLNGITTSEVTLVDHDNNSWDIDMAKIEDRFILKNGWQRFAKEKCLEEGEFLVFEYDGNSTFYVKIFSKSGCRKEAENCDKVVPIVILDEDSYQSCKKTQLGCKRKHSSIGLKINEKSISEGPSKGAKKGKSKRAYGANNGDDHEKQASGPAKCVPPNRPHFIVHFSPTKLIRLEIPRTVMREWDIKLESTMNLRNEKGKLWLVQIYSSRNGRCYLGIGFTGFLRSNNIETGHQCDFEFVIAKGNIAKEILVRVLHPSKCPK